MHFKSQFTDELENKFVFNRMPLHKNPVVKLKGKDKTQVTQNLILQLPSNFCTARSVIIAYSMAYNSLLRTLKLAIHQC